MSCIAIAAEMYRSADNGLQRDHQAKSQCTDYFQTKSFLVGFVISFWKIPYTNSHFYFQNCFVVVTRDVA